MSMLRIDLAPSADAFWPFTAVFDDRFWPEREVVECQLLRRFQGISGPGGEVARSIFMTQFGSSVR